MTILRVAMLSFHTCPLATLGGKDTGGMNVYVRELTRHLGQLGVHVDVFTRSQDEHVPHVLHDLGYGNRVVHVPAGPEIPLSKQTLTKYIPQFAEGILQFTQAKGLQYDIIHSHYWMSGVAAKTLKAAWNVPVVHMYHTLGLMKNRIARSEHEVEGAYRLDGEREALFAADQIVVATPAEKSQLEFLYHADTRKLNIIPPGVDVALFYPIPSDEAKEVIGMTGDDRMVLFVGRIEPLKGIEVLIRALARIREGGLLDCCPHYLVVIGGEPGKGAQTMDAEIERLKFLCQALGIGDLVVFLGKRGQRILPYYYSSAELVIVPSHYESFGMVALEAMACGTPVIASQVGGLAYLVEDGVTGFVVPDDDPDALADSMIRLMREPHLHQKLSEQAVARAQSYAWGDISKRMLALYQSTLQDACNNNL
jgi:D-inositol-3-phosphate glycosyltransferase